MKSALVQAYVFAIGCVVCGGCSDQAATTAAAQPGPTPTVEPTPSPPRRPPAWAFIAVGARAYITDVIGLPFVCSNATDFTHEMESRGSCPLDHAGRLVTIHKLRQDPGVFGGDAIYVQAKGWGGGLILDSNLVPVVPKGVVVVCPDRDSGWTLRSHDYEALDGVELRGSPFKAVVRHTLEPAETKGPAVHILSGPGSGKDGYLSFRDLENCKIDGTDFEPNFDWYDYEGQRGPYEIPEPRK
jgi:hypothetical protein